MRGSLSTDEASTPYADVTSYNNFYEFGTGKGDPAAKAFSLKPRPWTVSITGEVHRPQVVETVPSPVAKKQHADGGEDASQGYSGQ
jgi:DMSO/TMAO reductase YedYZ molybdopterin-dependent catalytic subunit